MPKIPKPRGVGMLFLVLAGAVAAWCVGLWLLGQAAAVVFSGQSMPISVLEMVGVSLQLPEHWDDPVQAWPPEVRAQLPGPVGFYLVSAVVLVTILFMVVGVWALQDLEVKDGLLRRKSSKNKRPAAVWAGRQDVRELRHDGSTRLVLGYTTGWRRQLLAAEARHSVIVFGPTQMLKTAGVIIPALLEWNGPALATSVKPDVIQTTRRYRETRGEVWVYDPTGGLGRLASILGRRAVPVSCAVWVLALA